MLHPNALMASVLMCAHNKRNNPFNRQESLWRSQKRVRFRSQPAPPGGAPQKVPSPTAATNARWKRQKLTRGEPEASYQTWRPRLVPARGNAHRRREDPPPPATFRKPQTTTAAKATTTQVSIKTSKTRQEATRTASSKDGGAKDRPQTWPPQPPAPNLASQTAGPDRGPPTCQPRAHAIPRRGGQGTRPGNDGPHRGANPPQCCKCIALAR